MSKSGTHIDSTRSTGRKTVGYYTIGSTYHIHVAEKPTEEQLKNIKDLLGWEWSDWEYINE